MLVSYSRFLRLALVIFQSMIQLLSYYMFQLMSYYMFSLLLLYVWLDYKTILIYDYVMSLNVTYQNVTSSRERDVTLEVQFLWHIQWFLFIIIYLMLQNNSNKCVYDFIISFVCKKSSFSRERNFSKFFFSYIWSISTTLSIRCRIEWWQVRLVRSTLE